jgi:Uma2 family endonuclease
MRLVYNIGSTVSFGALPMVSAQDHHRLTPQDYFEWEAQQALRYEYFDGEVFAMAGGSLPHADIALNVASLLKAQLQGRCKVRNSDAKVGITEDGPFVYPDVSVSCDERDRTAQKFSRYPCLIVEVVSPGTEAYDRGGKFTLYRRLDSLKEYVLVGSEAKTVEVFCRSSEGSWAFIPYGLGETIELASLGITVPMEAIYEDVVLEKDDSESGV